MSDISNKTLAIAALARDCAPALSRAIPKIERLRSYFASSVVVVVENGSSDNTREVLLSWKENAKNIVILDGNVQVGKDEVARDTGQFNPSGGFQRIERMAVLRNAYMDYLSRLEMKIHFLLVIDVDIDDFSELSIIGAMRNAPYNWMGLFANGVKYFRFFRKKIKTRYYDDYAFVPYNDKVPPCVEMSFDELKKNRRKLEKVLKKNKFVQCFSAFGGIGIYRYQYMKDLRYAVGRNTRNKCFEAICEHIPVNMSLCDNGANYVVRDLCVFHTRISRLKDIILEFLPAVLWLFLYNTFKRHFQK
jgi:glycosyltransferase involved in cell wall biosynthesis